MESYHPNNIEQITEETAQKYSGISMAARAAIYIILFATLAAFGWGCKRKDNPIYLPPPIMTEDTLQTPNALETIIDELNNSANPPTSIVMNDPARSDASFKVSGQSIPYDIWYQTSNGRRVIIYSGGIGPDEFTPDELNLMNDAYVPNLTMPATHEADIRAMAAAFHEDNP